MKDRLCDLTALCDDVIEAPVVSSAFLEELLPKVDGVQKLIERISHCVGEVKLKHRTILAEVSPNYARNELEQLNNGIKQTADVIHVKLKDLEGTCSESESSVYCRIQNVQYTALSLRFSEIMNMYNQELLLFQTKSEERLQRQLQISGKDITTEEMEVLLHSNNPAIFTSNISSCITGQALNEIESRHKDILALEANIRELNHIFMDIAMLVDSQGEMANNITKTVMKAGNSVDQGKENIKQAVDYKSSWRIRLPPLPSFKRKAKPGNSKGS